MTPWLLFKYFGVCSVYLLVVIVLLSAFVSIIVSTVKMGVQMAIKNYYEQRMEHIEWLSKKAAGMSTSEVMQSKSSGVM